MSSIASQVVFHPTVSQSLKLGSTTLGRDKLYRAIQYFARFYAWYLISRGDKDAAVRWSALKSHLATARKLLRLGKPVEHLQAALKAALAPGPQSEQITAIGRQIAYFAYLSFDAVVWANSVKFLSLKPETASTVAKVSNRFWLAGILIGLLNGSLKLARLSRQSQILRKQQSSNLGEKAETESELRTIEANRAAARHQLVMDSLDIWIPATALELSTLNDGVLGIAGLITSVMALQKQWTSLGGK